MARSVTARWFSDGSGAWIEDPDGQCLLRISIERWHERGDRVGASSWVVSFTVTEEDGPMEHRRRLESGVAEPALHAERRTELTLLALEVADRGRPQPPEPVVFDFGEPDELLIRQIEMLHLGCGEALERVNEASRDHSPWASVRLHQALTEALLWIRLIDDVLDEAWRAADRAAREIASQRTDRWLARLVAAEPGRAETSAALRAYAQRLDDGQPYQDWATAAIGRGADTSQEEFDAFRWLAGKLLHLAPRPVVELAQWRPGAEPRWKWRGAEAISRKAQEKRRHWRNRGAYERHLAGRDVVGSLDLAMTLIEAEHMLVSLRMAGNS
jgi:hypothetical protein